MVEMMNDQIRLMQLKLGCLMLKIDKIILERDIYKAQIDNADTKTIKKLKKRLYQMEKPIKKAVALYANWKTRIKEAKDDKYSSALKKVANYF